MKKYSIELLKQYHKELFINIVLLLTVCVLSIAGPVILKNGLNDIYNSTSILKTLFKYACVLFGLYLFKFMQNRFKFWFGLKFKKNEFQKLYNEFFHMNYDAIQDKEPTYIMERIENTVQTVFNFFSASLTGLLVSMIISITALCLIFTINKTLFIFYLIQIPLQYIGFKKLLNGEKSRLTLLSKDLQTKRAICKKNLKVIVSSPENMKQLADKKGIKDLIVNNFACVLNAEKKGNQYAMDVCVILDFIASTLKNASYIIIVIYFGTKIISFGDLAFLMLINDMYYSSLSDMLNLQIDMRELAGALDFVDIDLRYNVESNGNVRIEHVNEITIESKSIGYEDNILLANVFAKFDVGDIVFLTGESGRGKSTIAKMIAKLNLNDGVKINNYDIKDINNEDVRKKILYISQKTELLPTSIINNITLGEHYSDDVLDNLYAEPFMDKIIDLGLDTEIQENRANISGGDAQKIILARTILMDPDVLILDESFNSIDFETGKDIMTYIRDKFNGRIIILISHSQEYRYLCNKECKIMDKHLIINDIL